MKELEEQVKKAKNEKAPGESGVTNEAYKAISTKAKEILLQSLFNIYEGRSDPEEWHEANLKCLHKKGDSTDPNNWRAICLKDMSARLMSGILSSRLVQVIQEHGVSTQFGSQPGMGCQDGLFALRTALSTRRYHNQATWTLFVDLVKAFDTVHHEFLFQLLEKYGVPKELTNVVRKMYENMHVKLKIGKEDRDIPYTVGVQQGDNMAPVLFLFTMQAFAECSSENGRHMGDRLTGISLPQIQTRRKRSPPRPANRDRRTHP
jgi:hypothetical protein